MSDLISREDAIKALGERTCGDTDWDLGCRNQWDWGTEILRTLPSVEPERKKGELKTVGFLTCQCSECGAEFHELEYTNFCSNCGTKWSE